MTLWKYDGNGDLTKGAYRHPVNKFADLGVFVRDDGLSVRIGDYAAVLKTQDGETTVTEQSSYKRHVVAGRTHLLEELKDTLKDRELSNAHPKRATEVAGQLERIMALYR